MTHVASAQNTDDTSLQPVSAGDIIQQARANEQAIEFIQGRIEEVIYNPVPSNSSQSTVLESAKFTVALDGRFSLSGRTRWSTPTTRVFDGNKLVRFDSTSQVVENFPLSVLDGAHSHLNYEALGLMSSVTRSAWPLRYIESDGVSLDLLAFTIVENTEEVVVIDADLEKKVEFGETESISIALLPQKGFAVSRYVSNWSGGRAIEYFEGHIQTAEGHWVPRRYRVEYHYDESAEPNTYGETLLSDVQTNLTVDETTFDTSLPPGTILIDYTKFGDWFFHWRSEYGITDFAEASESLFQSYPRVWYGALFISMAIALSIIAIVFIVYFRRTPTSD